MLLVSALNRLIMHDCSVKQSELLTWWSFQKSVHKLLCSFLHEADAYITAPLTLKEECVHHYFVVQTRGFLQSKLMNS